jgi:prolyl-tRNA editing enzyme YbaK/EbsC (Cys-tRNA(Pro) deacylase)
VRAALAAAGVAGDIVALAATARSAQEAADSIGCPLGAIVKSLVFRIGDRPVMALVAGDRQCEVAALPPVLGIDGQTRRADADFVRAATGFAIGGVAPVGHIRPIPVAIDSSLERFATVYAAAGHPHCVFATAAAELQRLTGGRVSDAIAR